MISRMFLNQLFRNCLAVHFEDRGPTRTRFRKIKILRMKSVKHQDKVNYAVSEREEKVTDVRTITELRAVLGCTGLQLGFTEL